MTVIAGGVLIQEGIPRPVNPFGRIREVRRDETIQAAIDAAAAGDVIYIEGKADAGLLAGRDRREHGQADEVLA